MKKKIRYGGQGLLLVLFLLSFQKGIATFHMVYKPTLPTDNNKVGDILKTAKKQTVLENNAYAQYKPANGNWCLLKHGGFNIKMLSVDDDVHPRIMLTQQRLKELKGNYLSSPIGKILYRNEITAADSLLLLAPPPYLTTTDAEQLWQRDVGNAMPILAFAYAITSEDKYLTSVLKWTRQAATYPTWGRDRTDLAAGQLLFGVAAVYDWCFYALTATQKNELEVLMMQRGQLVYRSLLSEGAWINKAYLQNHLWITATGLMAAANALVNRRPEVQQWIDTVRAKMQRTFVLLGTDGASHEGVAYWSYGLEYLLRYAGMERDLYHTNYFDTPWLRKTAGYYLSMSLPASAWKMHEEIIDMADGPRRCWYGPGHLLLKLAAEYQNGFVQKRAYELYTQFKPYPGSEWQALIWFNPNVIEKSMDDYPLLNIFGDMNIITTRTGWGENTSVLVVKSGPPLGHDVLKYHDGFSSSGHVHANAGSFCLYGNGRFLIRNPGFTIKKTSYENTLLVNGTGQSGEDKWFKYQPTVASSLREANTTATVIIHSDKFDYLIADAATAYPPEAGLETFRRHMLFIKPASVLVILDEVVLSKPGEVVLSFHPEVPFVNTAVVDVYHSNDSLASLQLQVLSPIATVTTLTDTLLNTVGKTFTLPVLKVSYSGVSTVWGAVAMSWVPGNKSTTHVNINMQHDAGSPEWKFMIQGKGVLQVNPFTHTANYMTTP